MDVDDERSQAAGTIDPNSSMDWAPLPPDHRASRKSRDDADADDDKRWSLAPQRFFAPQVPTGLEVLFEKTLRVDDGRPGALSTRPRAQRWWKLW